jgi:hypothetical protein
MEIYKISVVFCQKGLYRRTHWRKTAKNKSGSFHIVNAVSIWLGFQFE